MTTIEMKQYDFGHVLDFTITDKSGNAMDVSSFTSVQFLFIKPDNTSVTKQATFKNNGTDGIVTYTTEDGLLSLFGKWMLNVRVSKDGKRFTTVNSILFTVRKNIV